MQRRFNRAYKLMRGASLLMVCAVVGTVSAHGDASGIVLERHTLMTELKDANKAITGMVRGKQALARDQLADHARTMAKLAERMSAQFPDSDASRFGPGSNTRQNTWREFTRFKSLAEDLAAQATALAESAQAAPLERLKTRVGAVGDTCKQCHKSYRRKKRH